MLLQGNLQTLDKAVPIERLRQVTNRPSLKRLRTNLIIGKRREENERYATTFGKQMGLQLDAAHAGHLDICNHTREFIEAVRPQEVFGGRECIHDVPERPHKAIRRGAHGCIIVNDCD
jgi:hypothetical protein